MNKELEIKFESGSLDWSQEELDQLEPWMVEQILQDIEDELEHQQLITSQ